MWHTAKTSPEVFCGPSVLIILTYSSTPSSAFVGFFFPLAAASTAGVLTT
jgi:hypothetical protein